MGGQLSATIWNEVKMHENRLSELLDLLIRQMQGFLSNKTPFPPIFLKSILDIVEA
jgi:hypothetical protein